MADLAAAADHAPSAAGLGAPSAAGRRPWRLRTRTGAVELLADTADIAGSGPEQPRQTVIACGAALLNLRLAVAHLGVEPVVTLLPVADEPDLLARVEPGRVLDRSPADEDLYLALGERRTSRAPFSHPLLPHEVLVHLGAAVTAEGAELVHVTSGDRLRRLDRITAALPLVAARDLPSWSSTQAGSVQLLVTDGDDVLDWLHAGQALQRLLLTATTDWVQARFPTRVLEVPYLRERVRRELCPGRAPQAILELGRRSVTAA
jgi:hypothetical protein